MPGGQERRGQKYGVEIHNVLIKSGDPSSRFQVHFFGGRPGRILAGMAGIENPSPRA